MIDSDEQTKLSMRVFLEIAYNGAPFKGWQIQPHDPSVQEEIQRALSLLYRTSVPITGAGRTDTEVNALYSVAHTDLPHNNIPLRKLRHSLNGILYPHIQILNIRPVEEKAHARFDALSRTYYYFISTERSPFWGSWVFHTPILPDIERMNHAAEHFLGTHDFTSFSKLHTDTHTNLCTVTHARWKEVYQNKVFQFEVTANRFLRNMVRAMVGTLIEVGQGKREPQDMPALLQAENRSLAGASVPGYPLFLANVTYPNHIYLPQDE